MTSNLPSSFASAAAGQNRDARSGGRNDYSRVSGIREWPRVNGTRTFRRSSNAPPPFGSTSLHISIDNSHSGLDSPTKNSLSHQPVFESSGPQRYSRNELLELYKLSPEYTQIDVSNLYAAGWNPTHVNGNSTRSWGKSECNHQTQDPSICWDPNGTVKPVALHEMTPEERELFATDVNSTVKPPQQQIKDGIPQGVGGGGAPNGRKTSFSLNSAGMFPVSSPSLVSRPGTRRRETTDANLFSGGGLMSPTAGRFPRDEQGSWLSRKTTDPKDLLHDEPEEGNLGTQDTLVGRGLPYGLTRSNTSGGTGFAAASSLWNTSSATPATPGLAAFGNFALPQAFGDRRISSGFGGGRGESRLAHLIPKDLSEQKPPGEASDLVDPLRTWRSRQRTDTDPFGGDEGLVGSAVLGGAQDTSPPTFPSQVHSTGAFDTPAKGSAGDFGMAALDIHDNNDDGSGPISPSETNPYRSPQAQRGDDGHDIGEQPTSFSNVQRTFGTAGVDGSDRSQTSSVGPKAYSGFGSLSGWPAGTPDRERLQQGFAGAFGGSIFSPLGDLQSPGLGPLGNVFAHSGGSGASRGSKLGSLMPQAMQSQMQMHDDQLADSTLDLRQASALGPIGRGAIGAGLSGETNSPSRVVRPTAFEELVSGSGGFVTSEQVQPSMATTSQAKPFGGVTSGSPFPTHPSSDTSMPARTMVMPDRMRWVYLDPQGNMQGPFNGLEMNDWYKAQFFTPDLRVRKVEDSEFEPLGQLIRRIGNSREPFLVPQMGIPHGEPSQRGPFAVGEQRGAVPPLQSAFPTFGRTLTAEEQNNLERRKQEEQYNIARQREYVAHQQQVMMKLQMPSALHHHSSAHSLQSQPSFGSRTSPGGMLTGAIGSAFAASNAFFDAPTAMPPDPPPPQPIGTVPSDMLIPDLSLQERQMLASMQATGGLPSAYSSSAGYGPIGDNSTVRHQNPAVGQFPKDTQGFSARLKEFQEIRAARDAEEAAKAAATPTLSIPSPAGAMDREKAQNEPAMAPEPADDVIEIMKKATKSTASSEGKRAIAHVQLQTQIQVQTTQPQAQEPLSLTQQVRKTQADAAAAAAAAISGLPLPFPPPAQSSTPLPAPTARMHSHLPSHYRDQLSPVITSDTHNSANAAMPSPAPWAQQTTATEGLKGPSLKEIQEAEAKKAAKAEEAAAALRRAALEQETAVLREREKAALASTGLPLTSTWGTGSPVSATASSWAKPSMIKTGTAPNAGSAAAKKTLADIQREEEFRKQKAREQQAHTQAAAGAQLGKRYADLASKPSGPPGLGTPPSANVIGGWATVGAGGKVKGPAAPAPVGLTRTSSVASASKPANIKSLSRPANPPAKDAVSAATEEFIKWVHRELSRGLDKAIDVDSFAATLAVLPLDAGLIADSVYSSSTTMDGRHFSEEYVRRKKLADKGIVEKQPIATHDAKNSGWSEVAKKSGSTVTAKEDASVAIPGGQFKVVPGRKKGKK